MPIKVFGSTSRNSKSKIDTNLFAEKPFSRTNYLESNLEEVFDLKNHYTIKNLPHPISIREAASKIYVDKKLNDPSIVKNITDIDFNDKKLENIKIVKVNYQAAVNEH